jgi:hypothetical protein
MLDTIHPWFLILWGAALLLPLALKQRNWVGTPIRRIEEPGRFWLQAIVGALLIAMGAYEAWSRFQGG